jgi:hypothetical protein
VRTSDQGPPLVHFSTQHQHFLWDVLRSFSDHKRFSRLRGASRRRRVQLAQRAECKGDNLRGHGRRHTPRCLSPCLRQPQLLGLVHPVLDGVHRVAVKAVEHGLRRGSELTRTLRGYRADAAELPGAGRERVAAAQARHGHGVCHSHLLRVERRGHTHTAIVKKSKSNGTPC